MPPVILLVPFLPTKLLPSTPHFMVFLPTAPPSPPFAGRGCAVHGHTQTFAVPGATTRPYFTVGTLGCRSPALPCTSC